MRRFNAALTAVILLLFLVHGIEGGFQLMGFRGASSFQKTLAWITAGLITVHMLIGVKLTADTLQVRKKTGVSYFKENALFWARRISGFAVMILLLFHITAFGGGSGGRVRLLRFTSFRLAVQLLLTAAIAVHVISNVKPMLIALGIPDLKRRAGDILAVLSVLLLFMAFAMIVYYIRWNS